MRSLRLEKQVPHAIPASVAFVSWHSQAPNGAWQILIEELRIFYCFTQQKTKTTNVSERTRIALSRICYLTYVLRMI